MARKKVARNVPITPWLSGKMDCREGRFIQVGNSLLLSPAFTALSAGARHLYLCMTMESGGKNRVQFTHGAAKKYGVKPTSFDRYAQELQRSGFIRKLQTEERYVPAEFEFTFDWKQSKTAPHSGEGNG